MEAVPVAYLGEGEVLGELALLTGSPRSATVRAPERAEVLTLEQAVFLDLMATLPRFAQDLCAVLAAPAGGHDAQGAARRRPSSSRAT